RRRKMPTRFEELNSGLKSTDIKGKAYVEVNERIKAFRKMFPDGFIRSASTAGFLAVRDMQIGTLVTLIQISIYGFLCWYLLDHRLNLE
ncbi:MAG: hypothetical protein II433_03230, partial [Acidaminococcaceae bacterium]|nr:hypothetical protein [Acidaminococcaceae bacterium]